MKLLIVRRNSNPLPFLTRAILNKFNRSVYQIQPAFDIVYGMKMDMVECGEEQLNATLIH